MSFTKYLLLLLLCFFKGAVGAEVRIKSVDDFKTFVNEVNSGTNYSGTTVLLNSDLSLSGETLEPIGLNTTYQFRGVFDGQGHIISGLKTSTSSQYTGLFGYSNGMTIRNVVLDSSCSIINSFNGSFFACVGGLIGNFKAYNGQCNIENSVNMADVSFNGNIGSSLILGGIAGYLDSSSYPIYVKNCVNYGFAKHSGTSFSSEIGGIAGYLYGSTYARLYNCLNYGTIRYSCTTSNIYVGGIAGYSYYAYIENCVSAGKISTQGTSPNSYVGSIVGDVSSFTFINYCYYTSEMSGYRIYGTGTLSSSSYALSYNSTTFKLNGTVSVGNYTGTSLINALNAVAGYYFLRGYSKWLLNKEKKSVKFTINSRTSLITMNSQVILLPSLASEGTLMFDGWYNDSECVYLLELFEITEDKTLYGKFEENINDYTITFDTKGGESVAPITAQFGSVVQLPSESIREHCSIIWENEYGDYAGFSLTMPAHNFTLYAVWKCTHITRIDDFVDFSKAVNSGTTNYSGTTVYLDSDLSLSDEETLEPIGKDSVNYFRGVFDGQGHIISDLKMNTSSIFTGLFGYSEGLTIRNVVLDSSCSITNSYSGSNYVYAGGIIGVCAADNGQCKIENIVNVADVAFSGNISSNYLFFGGVAGHLYSSSSSHLAYAKNCANYGSVTQSGASYYSYIGGVVGYLSGYSYNYLYNCLNYGTITHSGTKSYELDLGGIVGYSNHAYIENCVNAGKISTQKTPLKSYIGSIVGNAYFKTSFIHCYYTSDVGGYPINGTGKILNTTGTPTSATTVNLPLVTNLNNYASDNGWNEWLLNMNNAPVTFKVNDYSGFTLNSQVILLPTLAVNNSDDGDSFIWFTDSSFTTPFLSLSVSEGTTLYGAYSVVVTVTFDANGGSVPTTSKKVALNRTYGTLPEASRTGHMLVGWFTERTSGMEVTSKTIVTTTTNHTLYAKWAINSYTLIFDFGNGNEKVSVLAFNATIVYPEDPVMEGYTFNGWDSNITNMPARDFTITAIWEESLVPSRSSTSSINLVVEVAVPMFIIFIIIILVMFVFMRKEYKDGIYERRFDTEKPLIFSKDNDLPDGYCRVVLMSKDEVEGNGSAKASMSVLTRIYTKDYVRPTIKEALLEAKLTDEQVKTICSACNNAAKINAEEGRLFDGFTEGDAAAVAMYTYDFGLKEFESNPYRIINRSIVGRNYNNLQKASGLLYLVMTALRKLPRVTGKVLYRGVRGDVSISKSHYHKGNVVTWPALSSTSPDMDATKAFLAKGSKSGNAMGTLFIIESGWGYDIQPYSLFPGEEEILLEPERQFEVVSVVPSSDLTAINLKMLDTPLVLPHIFGGA